jgi:hypothetical protein
MRRWLIGCAALLLFVSMKSVQVHAAQDGPHGTVTGKLTGADGKPIASAWVTAIASEGEIDATNPEQLTNDEGEFSLDVPPGKYFIVANYDWPATESAPVLSTYYAGNGPGVEGEQGAKAVEVKNNAKVKNIDIKVSRVLKPLSIEVLVTGPDGKPLPSGDAYLTQINQPGIAGSDSGATYADKTGHVKLLAFEGIDYLLWAENGVGKAKTCAVMMKLDKTHMPTGVVTMQVDQQQPTCSKQEDAARNAAYAMQPRAS